MKSEIVNEKLVATGIAMLLFGIIIAVISGSMLAYIFGGLGLFLTVLGCLQEQVPYDSKKDRI